MGGGRCRIGSTGGIVRLGRSLLGREGGGQAWELGGGRERMLGGVCVSG